MFSNNLFILKTATKAEKYFHSNLIWWRALAKIMCASMVQAEASSTSPSSSCNNIYESVDSFEWRSDVLHERGKISCNIREIKWKLDFLSEFLPSILSIAIYGGGVGW